MGDISRVALFGKLNSVGYKAIESAAVFCKLRGNPFVELEHWLAQLLQLPDSDLHRVIRHAGLDESAIANDLTRALDRLPRGATSISDLSTHVESAVERGWVYATLKYGDNQVRTGHLMVAMLKSHGLRNALVGISRQFDRIDAERLAEELPGVVSGSPEEGQRATDGSIGGEPGETSQAMAPAAMGKQEALKRFAVDLTDRARRGELIRCVGRDEEIRQIIDILMRRRQNNPILTGEAGVGKTAVVEGFALRIAAGDVPPPLQGRDAAHARHRPAAGRRQHEGRVREPPAAGDRRGAGVAEADHPVHRRGAHADRRRRRGRAPAMPPTCSSRRWPAARCAPSPPPPGPNTRSTSRRTRR
jgi:type VI secretion system protein VasG